MEIFLVCYTSPKNGYLYAYSALAQSLAVLLGILGVFGIYRLQVQHTRISDLVIQIGNFLNGIAPWTQVFERISRFSEEELLGELRKIADFSEDKVVKRNPNWGVAVKEIPAWKARARELLGMLDAQQKSREAIKERLLPLMTSFAVLTFIVLLLVGRSEDFYEKQVLGAWITLLIFMATASIMIWMVRFTYFCLKDR